MTNLLHLFDDRADEGLEKYGFFTNKIKILISPKSKKQNTEFNLVYFLKT